MIRESGALNALTPLYLYLTVGIKNIKSCRLTLISLQKSALPLVDDTKIVNANTRDWLEASQRYSPELQNWVKTTLANTSRVPIINSVLGNSPYLTSLMIKHPDALQGFFDVGPEGYIQSLLATLDDSISPSINEAMSELRHCKAKAALVIALADITNSWSLHQVTSNLSDLADACVAYAVRTLLLQYHQRGEIKLSNESDPEFMSGYVVLGLGKLGSRELNYSSDIDLFVFFNEEKIPYIGKKTSHEFAVRLTKDLVRVLHERTALGYVFRTDLRLRPDPGSTALAVSQEAAQIYYESYGQNWERAALIKARCIAGDGDTAEDFLKDIKPFIWRKSLDFYAIQDIQSIKRQMYAHKGGSKVNVAGHNIKLGRGGIREIEFYAQIQQLIWGGRFPEARTPRTLDALNVLNKLKFVTHDSARDLTIAYKFLRKLEHRLQMINDEQTQTLPADDTKLAGIATFMGYDSVDTFKNDVTEILNLVETHYADLFEDAPTLAVEGNLVFTGTDDDPETLETIQRLGFENASTVIQTVRTWHHGRYRSTRSDRARQLLTEIMPSLLASFGKTSQPDAALVNFDRCLSALPAGVSIFSVFYANPQLLELVGEIMGDAPRLAEHLTRRPTLLDYVLEPEFYQPLEDLDILSKDLKETLDATDSFEFMLDACRRWVNDHQFRVGVQCLRQMTDPIVAAKGLTSIAEAAIINVFPRVTEEFSEQYGRIENGEYAFLGYGKLGSYELTPTSDLDLVAVYNADIDSRSEGGAKSLPTPAYYMRLTQRLVTAFSSLSQEGRMYEIDMRLRPSGNAGPLASSIEAFQKYQSEDAWTWEHMALSRSRIILGDQKLCEKIRDLAIDVLSRPRNELKLVVDVYDMRERIKKENKGENTWDIKYRSGGLLDAEFVLQYLRLKHPSHKWEEGNLLSIIDKFRTELVLQEMPANILRDAVNLWSRLQFILRLTTIDAITAKTIPEGLKSKLAKTVGVKSFSAVEKLIDETSESVSEIYRHYIEEPAQKFKNSENLAD